MNGSTPPYPMPDVTRFVHPVLPSGDLRRGNATTLQLAGRAFTLTRDAKGAVSVDAASMRAIERHGYLWLAGRDLPDAAMPGIDYASEGFEPVGAFGVRFNAPLHVSFDNFSEDEHTSWVHNFLGWREEDAGNIHFEAENFDDRTEVFYRAPQRPSPWTPLLLTRHGDIFKNRWVTRFDPIHTVYTLSWHHPKTDAPRPVVSRFAIFFVPETSRTTWLHSFAYARVAPGWRVLMPVVRRVVPKIGLNEVNDDARFIPAVADTPIEFRGMRLGRYDKPLIHNRKLMKSLYWGSGALEDREIDRGAAEAPANAE
jgi:phenylpropionate dioxygenase-like ring-hydroxylating dioxygenase large terminal subunit